MRFPSVIHDSGSADPFFIRHPGPHVLQFLIEGESQESRPLRAHVYVLAGGGFCLRFNRQEDSVCGDDPI